MNMSSPWLIAAVSFSMPLLAQVGPAVPLDEIKPRNPEQIALLRALHERGFYDLPDQGERYVIRVPVTIHIVRLSSGEPATGVATVAEAQAALAQAASYWEGSGITFFQRGAVRFINDVLALEVDGFVQAQQIFLTTAESNTVNVYFTRRVVIFGDSLCGLATNTSEGPGQGVIVGGEFDLVGEPPTNCLTGTANTELANGLGDYFDLFATQYTSFGAECPDGSNCATAGDLVCDTPADPGLNFVGNMMPPSCAYTGTSTRCGDPFNPDPTNIMSSANPRSCRTRFSPGQFSRARGTLVNLRPSLIENGQPSIVWVDFNANSIFPNGDFTNPYTTFLAGLNAAPSGATVVLRNRTSNETGVFSQPVVIDSFFGSAVVGS